MSLRALTCPRCGAPLPPRAHRVVVPCAYCGAAVADDGGLVHAAAYRRALAELSRRDTTVPRIEVAGFPYRVLGRVARGESSDVFLAERDHPVTERVLVKVLRSEADADLQDREWDVLSTLLASDTLDPETARRIPQLVGRGKIAGTGRHAIVVRAISGFVDTFDDVMRAYPSGVDGRHAVWMWRRVLEVLAGVHRAGVVHGAVLPQHLVVHARDHGVLLVGWSAASRIEDRAPLPAISTVARDVYPPALLAGAPPSPAADLAMSARSIARLLGGTADRAPASTPGPIAALVAEVAAGGGGGDAWQLRGRVGEAAHEVYGRPRYHPFPMPGWRIGAEG